MMRYWPLSVVMQSPLLGDWDRAALTLLRTGHMRKIPNDTLYTCHNAAQKIPACTSMLLMHTEDAGIRRVYVRHPTQENWLTLERGGFVDTGTGFGYVMDALH